MPTGTFGDIGDVFGAGTFGDIEPAIRSGVCQPWAVVSDVRNPKALTVAEGLLDDTLQMASDILFDLTGRRWAGECTSTVRPTYCECVAGGGSALGLARALAPQWGGSLSDLGHLPSCACLPPPRTRLGRYPVQSIVEVLIDGATVPPDEYRVDDYRWLIGLQTSDGRRRVWPCCQRLDLPSSEPGTFEVTFAYGQRPPIGGRLAAAALGGELALAFDPDSQGACRLPKRVTSITRQSVSIAVIDPLKLFDEGKTGLPEVDVWVAAVNRAGKLRRGSVLVPGSRPVVHRSDT